MRGLPVIQFKNAEAVAQFRADTEYTKVSAKEWLRRAHVALDKGEYQMFADLTARAAKEVAHLR
jgi:hypothetical protein